MFALRVKKATQVNNTIHIRGSETQYSSSWETVLVQAVRMKKLAIRWECNLKLGYREGLFSVDFLFEKETIAVPRELFTLTGNCRTV